MPTHVPWAVIMVALCLSPGVVHSEEAERVWTSLDGRTITARLKSATDTGIIEIQRSDGQVFRLNVSQLSVDDQAYVQSHLSGASGPAPKGIPPSMTGRVTPASRAALLATAGAPEGHEEAVLKVLRFLKDRQNPDGSFGAEFKPAMTGFVLLAFLGHFETPESPEFGDVATKAALYLMETGNRLKTGILTDNDSQSSSTYEHGIATYALAELLALSQGSRLRIPRLESTVRAALDVIADGQMKDGGWTYGYRQSGSGGDTCLGSWQLQALLAAHEAGLVQETERAIGNSIDFYRTTQCPDGGFAYRPASSQVSKAGLSGIGPMVFERWAPPGSAETAKAIAYLNGTALGKGTPVPYGWYFTTHAYMLAGGSDRDAWGRFAFPKILALQTEDGSFKGLAGAGPTDPATVSIFGSAQYALILEAPYRYLPASPR